MLKLQRAQPWLGTIIEITVVAATVDTIERGMRAAFSAIAEVQRRLSYHDPASELSRLNHEAASASVRVSTATAEVLRAALTLAEESGGAFDPTVAPRLHALGYLPATPRAPRADARATFRDVILKGRTIHFRRPLRLDLGGIAKGHAVDRACAALQAAGADAGCVNAGGDLRVFGPQPQTIHLRHPAHPGHLAHALELRAGAVATSAGYFSRKRWRGRTVCALLDGRTREPGDFPGSISIVAPTAMLADALTKIALFAPPTLTATILARHHATALHLDAAARLAA